MNIFEDFNYKNKNLFKRNKIKIIKIVAFDNNKIWFNIFNDYKKNNYSSIIFYDYNIKLDEKYLKYLIKIPILPIIIQDSNKNSILVINNEDLNNYYNNNNYLNNNKYISNNIINTLDYHNDTNNKIEYKTNKYIDIAN